MHRRARRLAWVGILLLVPTGPLLSAPADEAVVALPGARPFGEALRTRLSEALAALPPDRVPRTRHRHPDGSPRYSNRLLLETSPYLQQHSHNPVDWHPWGDEAFETAARLGRPVLVSIGYSTCHWCHVMEEESFDDIGTARLLNERFIAVKVDRETRPDVDAIYMAAVVALQGSGGWPLNVWLTPDRKPFFGGTYFPSAPGRGRPSFREVLTRVADEYASNRGQIGEISLRLTRAIQASLEGTPVLASSTPGSHVLDAAMQRTAERVDRTWGGIGTRTKFPSTTPIRFLLRYHRRTGDATALSLALLTLDKMAAGGIHDHVGGGFHRYSTEPRWLVPHFEKMLYDNALLTVAYLEAAQLTGRDDLAEVARGILDYVTREMTAPHGGFYSATDADSVSRHGELEEGWFFTWTPGELESVLGAERASLASAWWGVTAAGDYEGRNILHSWRSEAAVVEERGITLATLHSELEAARSLLYAARERRPSPLRDDKILAAWNGLMISAFARAGFQLDEPRYIETAARGADFVLSNMRRDSRLLRVYQGGSSGGPAFLEDYAFFVAGLLDLYEADGGARWLREAIALQVVLDDHYADTVNGGYFRTADDAERLLVRQRPLVDGALPSGNSVTALNALRLAGLTGDARHLEAAAGIFSAARDLLERQPLAATELLLALDAFLDRRAEIIVVAPPDGTGREALLAPLRETFVPNRTLVVVTEDDALAAHARLNPLLQGKRALGARATAYVCESRVCRYPTRDPAELARLLDDLAMPPPPPATD